VRARFAQFAIDSETRQLRGDGREIHLSPKAFDLLCTLIETRPKVVEKADLRARIWPNTYVVDANLNILIGEIRRALGDRVQDSRFIRTVFGGICVLRHGRRRGPFADRGPGTFLLGCVGRRDLPAR